MLKSRALASCIAVLAVTPALAQTKTVNTVQQPARATVSGAPTLQIYSAAAGQADLCVGEVSGAYGNAMLAVTLNWTHRDRLCALIRQSKWAAEMGEVDLAREIMCSSADWRAAANRVGRPCLTSTATKER